MKPVIRKRQARLKTYPKLRKDTINGKGNDRDEDKVKDEKQGNADDHGQQQHQGFNGKQTTLTLLDALLDRLVEGPMTLWEVCRFIFDRVQPNDRESRPEIDLKVGSDRIASTVYYSSRW
jgi:hypothetical protein